LYNRVTMHVPLTPLRCLYRAVDLFGKKIGVVSGERRFTYAEFGERAERLAHGLRAAGVAAGDRVAFLSFNSNELLEGYYGPPLIGAIAMPLNVRLTAVELTGILNHAEPRVLVYDADFLPVVAQLRASCPAIQTWIEVGPGYEELLTRGRIERPDIFSIDETSICELFYTSGSTGTPKGVMLSHRTLYLHALSVACMFNYDDNAVQLATIPLFHANGWGRPQSATMLGYRQVMVRRFEPSHVLKLIAQERASGMELVPTMANALLNCPEMATADVSSMREINMGGAASSPELIARLEKAFRCRVQSGYGLTETSPVATTAKTKSTVQYKDEQDRLNRLSSTGWAMPGCEIRVVDLHGNDVPRDGESFGEIWIRGDLVMDGYYKEPQASAAALENGWLHTGDVAVWDAEGYVNIVDRKKDIIISGGENISSIEVERAIFSHPAVLECAVVASPDPQWGEVPAAFVVLKPQHTLNQEELCEYLRGRIAKFKMPRHFQFADQPLPKTGTGKILKRELREAFWQGKERRVQG